MRHANPCLGRFLAQAWQAPRGSSHCDRDDEKDDGVDDGDNDGGGDDIYIMMKCVSVCNEK